MDQAMLQKARETIAAFYHRCRALPLIDNSSSGTVKKVTVYGLFSSPTGLGTGARLFSRFLEAQGYNVASVDVTHLLTPNRMSVDYPVQAAHNDGVIILHLNPVEALRVINKIGHKNFKHRPRIAYWVWELADPPKKWKKYLKYFNAFWSPSQFSATSLSKLGRTFDVVPYAFETTTESTKEYRKETFTALVFADSASSLERKNPVASINAFLRAFPPHEKDVSLICKVSSNSEGDPYVEKLRSLMDTSPTLSILSKTLSVTETEALVSSCDVIISLHRSEGYGLVIAEGLLQGLDVVFTTGTATDAFANFSGAHQIPSKIIPVSNDTIYLSGKWHDPNVDDAAQCLKEIHDRWRNSSEKDITYRRKRNMEYAHKSLNFDTLSNHLKVGMMQLKTNHRSR